MPEITLNISKSVEENAEVYFEKAKKAKKKMKGAQEMIEKAKQKLEALKKKQAKLEKEAEKQEIETKKAPVKWYHKFRWFITSDGFLVIGGRDATSNEIAVKKHAGKDDLVFHTDMSGSPFFILKTEGKKPGDNTLREAADATCTFSKAWKLGMTAQSVFYVKPEQVTKEAKAGEYLTKGAFMIKGKTNYVDNNVNLAVGITKDHEIMAGPVEAVKANCIKFVEIVQGQDKTSAIAKKIQKRLGGDLDSIIRALPAGGCQIKKS